MPLIDNISIGHRYPFNACEILSSDNSSIIDILLNEVNSPKNKPLQENEYSNSDLNHEHCHNHFQSSSNKGDDTITKGISSIYSEIEEINKMNQIAGIVYDNLDYLFSFLDLYKPEECNIVLLGYFSQIFSHLLDARGETLISYIFTSKRKEVLVKLLYLVSHKSISDCLYLILTYTYDDNVIPMHEYKSVLLKVLLDMLEENKGNDIYESICDLLRSAMNNHEVNMLLLTKSFIAQLSELMSKASSTDFLMRNILKIIITRDETIISCFSHKVTPDFTKEINDNTQQIIGFGLCIKYNSVSFKKNDKIINDILSTSNLQMIITNIKQCGLLYLKSIIDQRQEIVIPEDKVTYNKPQEVFGLTRIAVIRYLRAIIDIFINAYANNFVVNEIDDLIAFLAEKQVFKNTVQAFFKYQFNNIYQTLFLEIISLVTNEYCPKGLVEDYFIQSNFLNLIISFVENEALFCYKSKRKIFNACIGAIVQLSKMIYESKNKHLRQILQANRDFCTLYDILLCEANKQYNVSNIIETIKQKTKEGESSRINKIDTEEKLSIMNLFSVFEMYDKEISLFQSYREGKEYSKELLEFRKVKVIQESDLAKKKQKSPQSVSSVPIHLLNANKETSSIEKESIDNIDNYYDNTYWSINKPNGQ